MLTIIEIEARADGGHGLQSQSHRTECWLEGWIAVPPQLEKVAWDCCGYCELDIRNGVLVGLTPGQVPEPGSAPEAEPTELERLRADLDYLAIMTGVEL